MIEAQSYEELGRKLRHIRLDQQLELEQAAHALHIRPRYLDALEDGNLDQLPGDAYVQGYFRQYARLLGLSPDEVLEAYQRIGALPQRRLFHIPERISREQHPGFRLVWMTVALALVLVFWKIGMQSSPPMPVMEARVASKPLPPEALIRAPECLSMDDLPDWPPCYIQKLPEFTAFLPAKLRSVMELAK
jgi:hypothetical protein